MLANPSELFAHLSQFVRTFCFCGNPNDLFVSNMDDLRMDMFPLAVERGVDIERALLDWTLFLTVEEKIRLQGFQLIIIFFSVPRFVNTNRIDLQILWIDCCSLSLWRMHFGYDATRASIAIFNLADNRGVRPVWSAASGKIPCPRTSNGKLWSASQKRFCVS